MEINIEGSNSPHRCATSDLSLSGCYIETSFPWPVGTNLDMSCNSRTHSWCWPP